MEGESPKLTRAKPAPPQRPNNEHTPIVTPTRLPGSNLNIAHQTHVAEGNGAERPKSVMFPPRPHVAPPQPPQSNGAPISPSLSSNPAAPGNAQPKLPPKVISKFPPRPNMPAPTPPVSSSPPSSPQTQNYRHSVQPPMLQPKQPKQHVGGSSLHIVGGSHPPSSGSHTGSAIVTPAVTPTHPPVSSIATPSHPITTPAHPPTSNNVITPSHPPVTTPTTPPMASSAAPTAPSATPTSPPNPARPSSPASGGVQARIQAMASAPGKDRPQAKAPAGAIPLPTTAAANQPNPANPKVPAKPTNLNGRLVTQRSSQMIAPVGGLDYEVPEREKFHSSRSKLAGFYSTPDAASDQQDNNTLAAPAGNAPSHVVPPPKPIKPRMVDLPLTSSQIASTQSSNNQTNPPPASSNPSFKPPVGGSKMFEPPAGSKVFENKNLKKVANEKPGRESFSDIIMTEAKKVDDEKVFYSDMLERIAKQSVAHTKSVDTSQHLAQLIRDHGSRSVFANEDPMFGKCLMQAGEVLRFTEVLRSQITLMWTNLVMAKSNDFLSNDIDETLAIKTRVESLKVSLDATNAKLKNMTTKGKVNLVKLSDLRRERDALIVKYKEEKARTLPTLMSTNHKHGTDFMGTMCDVLSEYSKFFDQGQQILANIGTDVEEYRIHITKKKEEFAKKQAEIEAEKEDEDEYMFPKDEATFSDVLSKALVESESQYHGQLDSIVKTYLQSIWSDGTLFSEIVKEDVTAIFGNIEVLADVQRKLKETLFQDSSNLTTESISRSFANFTNAISDVYMQYIKNHNKAQDTLEQCKKKSKIFCNTLKNCEARDIQSDRMELSLLLSVPLERIKQYEAYFSEISKKEQNEAIKANITQVLECLAGLSTAVVEANNQAKIKSILEVVNMKPEDDTSDSFTAGVMGVISGEKPVISPEEGAIWFAKKFLREGPMNLIESAAEKRVVKDYYFFLFNDVLVGVKRGGLPRSMGGSALAFLKGRVHAKYLWEINKAVIGDVHDEEGLKHCISLTINGITHILSADSEDSKQFWIFEITKAKEQIEKRKIFGVPLEELMNQATEVGRDVPSFFEKSIEFILANAIEEEGIFRLSGSANDIEKMRQKADQGLELAFHGIPYHNVTGIFKLFIRSMPSPIVTFDLYNSFLAAAKTSDRQEKIRMTKTAVLLLPKYHKYLLQYLMSALSQITRHVGTNKMTPYNLSIVFGPHVLKKRESDPVSELNDSKLIYDVIQLMIEDHDAVFSEVAAEREVIRRQRAQQQLELAQKSKHAAKQYKYEPTNVASPASVDEDDDEDDENDAKLQGITISLKEIVKQGFLQKKGANRRNWTSRWFVLKHKYLFYFKNQKDQTPKGMISLVGVKVAPSDRKPYCFAISSANREYLICGKSQTEADEWVAAIRTCTTD